MYKYPILLYWSEDDNCYITSVPDLPGCMSDGKTPEEAIKNTQVIIKEWIYPESEGVDGISTRRRGRDSRADLLWCRKSKCIILFYRLTENNISVSLFL